MSLTQFKDLKADVWAFDNDGTLYQNSKEVESSVNVLMDRYIANLFGTSEKEGRKKRKELLEKHNTNYTLIALRCEGIIDEDDFIQNTYLAVGPWQHGIMPNAQLREDLQCLTGEKIVLTNNPSEFAELIMRALGIRDLFSYIYGVRELNFVQKPRREAFAVLEAFVKGGKKVIFFDDAIENIKTAKSIGCITVLVGEALSLKNCDFWVPALI